VLHWFPFQLVAQHFVLIAIYFVHGAHHSVRIAQYFVHGVNCSGLFGFRVVNDALLSVRVAHYFVLVARYFFINVLI
jgi:hypothetical protein